MTITRNDYAGPQISALRYLEVKSLRKIVAACQMTDVKFAQDERGHYIESFDAPQWFWDLPRDTVRPPTREGQLVSIKRPRVAGNGLTTRIFNAVRENPGWNVADALAHFWDQNASTVRVQFGKARKAAT